MVCARVEEALQPVMAGVLLRRDGDDRCHPIAVVPAQCDVADLDRHSRLMSLVRAVPGPIDLAPLDPRGLAERLADGDRAWLRTSGVELLVPIACSSDGADALLALGPRRSEEPYGRDDLDLLSAIADSLALVLGATGDNERTGAMTECPNCGRCYSAAERACTVDRTTLVNGRVPRRLGDRYLIVQRLARGGMGTVYEAVDTQLGRQVAVKVLREELADRPDAVERFEREARLLASLSHPNIVTVHDAGVLLGTPYLVMERLEGRTVRELLQAHGVIGPGETVLILRGVAAALDAAHARGIVHRDLKPENVFLARVDNVRVPKVLDFGLARLVSGREGQPFVTRAAELWGTPAYMAPEQAPGASPVASWDLYALAVMTFELLTGRLPDGDLPPTLAAPLRDFFATALSPEPSQRPETARGFVESLETSLTTVQAGAA
jgi:tRNA A-37 threonylcarbamoyl transferase component Bud32